MSDYAQILDELARRRDSLERQAGALSKWLHLRSDVFAWLLRARQTLADQQSAFLDAITHHRSMSAGHTAETLGACRALRAILADVDATILVLIDR
jgi:hypothetical protein